MANRVLLGEHDNYGHGLFVSKPSTDVTGANKDYFLFDSTAASMGQLLIFQLESLGSGADVTRSFNNFGKNTFGLLYDSQHVNRYGVTIAETLAALSITITKVNSTTSTYTLDNSNSTAIKAAILIFGENV